MTPFVTIDELQKFLGTSYTDTDKLQMLLNESTQIIINIIGDITYGDKKEMIDMRQVIHGRDIFLRTPEVESINKINGKTYTGVIETDYYVIRPQNRRVRILDLYNYLGHNTAMSCIFSIEYTGGFKTIPEDIKQAQCLLCAYQNMKDGGNTIVKYVMGPRTVQYGSDSADKVYADAMKLLGAYKQVNLLP